MIKKILTLICLLIYIGSIAQPSTKLTLPVVLDSINKLMEKEHIPGLLLSMATKDSILYQGGLGLAHIEEERAVDANQLFRMGSITKTFAALSMLKLEAAGHFNLNDKLSEIAPEVPFINKWSASHPVKIVHLLEHTTGFDDMHFKAIYNKGDKELPTLQMVELHKESFISRWQPGTRMAYCNSAYVVLGYLIEKFSGQTYHDFVHENFFDPIGMHHSNFASFPQKKNQYAQGYHYEGHKFKEVPFYAIHGGIAGTLNSCGEDMAKYLQFYLNNGLIDTFQLIPKGWINQMEIPTSTIAAQQGKTMGGYGLANHSGQFYEQFPFWGHDGGIDGFSSMFRYNRAIGVGFSLSNNANGSMKKITSIIISYLTQNFTPPENTPIELNKEMLTPYLGFYKGKSPRNQIIYPIEKFFGGLRIAIKNDTLYTLSLLGEIAEKYLPEEGMTFRPLGQNAATAILTQNESGIKVFEHGEYYEKSSLFSHWLQMIWFLGSLFFGLTFLLFGGIWLIISIIRNESFPVIIPIKWLTVSALGLFLLIIFFLLVIDGDFSKVAEKNWKTIGYMILPFLLPVGALLGSWKIFKNFEYIEHKSLKYYLILVATSLVTLSVYLAWYGFIGLRFWAY